MTTTKTFTRTTSWMGLALLGMSTLIGCGENSSPADY